VIDLHSHILPNIDDGSMGMKMSIDMARLAVEDGTRYIAATPHYMPGMYDTVRSDVLSAVTEFRSALLQNDIDLTVYEGGDIHVTTHMVEKLSSGQLPTLNGTRYFLFEPPHHVVPPKLADTAKRLLDSGFVPVLTHPERLTWIEQRYDLVCELDELGVPIQLTAGSIVGDFGSRAKSWSHRMLMEGRVDIIASDAHNIRSRPPGLSAAVAHLRTLLGDAEAHRIVNANPAHVLRNEPLLPKTRRVFQPKVHETRKSSSWSLAGMKKAVLRKGN